MHRVGVVTLPTRFELIISLEVSDQLPSARGLRIFLILHMVICTH